MEKTKDLAQLMPATTIWDQVLTLIEGKVGPHSFSTWFKPTTLKSDQGRALVILVPAALYAEWLPRHYSVVMAEALACGTPVLALRQGSVPEVIRHGVTGYIGDTEDQLVEAVGRIGEIDRAACRAESERRFSPDAMAERYEQVYDRLQSDRNTPSTPLPLTLASEDLANHAAAR